MTLIKIYRISEFEKDQQKKVLKILKVGQSTVEDVTIETCFYIQLKKNCSSQTFSQAKKRLQTILGDPWAPDYGLSDTSKLASEGTSDTHILKEIGPRLSYSTPWSTNCGSICQSASITEIQRIEKSTRYFVKFAKGSEDAVEKQMEFLYDPMTEQVYSKPLDSFSVEKSPEKWTAVDVIGGGQKLLEEINSSMGLAFDDWDLEYYTKLFQDRVKRNPTTVELFDLAQSNSEHSRHWFFKGKYKIDGEDIKESLLDMVIATNNPKFTNDNNVIKFSDNSSAIEGWKVPALIPSDPTTAGVFGVREKERHIIFTAETHNFPTGVSPFSGATTGTGGRIRDVQAVGRGGHVIAGTAGYCFGNLHLPDYKMAWDVEATYPSNFASPQEIVIEASNGASDYGNKFGEPVLCGFSRSFGMFLGTDRREWIKPIMFSGGIGSLDSPMINKEPPKKGQIIAKIGGPVYRIGVGGGAASSVQIQGDNAASRDLGAVQRGDAEMEQKLNRVIRGCLEMGSNPILSIHDQGAGGNANVLKEMMEGAGGIVFTKAFTLGDNTLSTLEIWGAEYQESNAIIVDPRNYERLSILADRERCSVDKVGVITDDDKVRVYETEFQNDTSSIGNAENLPVDLNLDCVLGKMPQKVFEWTKLQPLLQDLQIPHSEKIKDVLDRVLRLPSVSSKRFLTNKVDRSVTGLVAQQQCVGPLQTPLADVAVIGFSYFTTEGAATSIGEQPIKILVDPEAGARMTVLEAFSNLASCLITDIKDVKCSGNWMWPAKLPGEGYALFQACKAMCEIMKKIGTAVDGGKDSLSMAARVPHPTNGFEVVKAPGSLVVSTYAPCPDIRKVVTPDLKSPGQGTSGALVLIKLATDKFRLGGSALAQVYSQIGKESPDLTTEETEKFVAAFKAIQKLIKDDFVLAMHDVSDGGVVTCLTEMAIAGLGGFEVNLPKMSEDSNNRSVLHELFNEEVGWVLETSEKNLQLVFKVFNEFGLTNEVNVIGKTTKCGPDAQIKFRRDNDTILEMSVKEAAVAWETTSFQLEKLQMNPELAEEEFKSLDHRKHTKYDVRFDWKDITLSDPYMTQPQSPRVAVIREEGSNGDREMVAAFIQAGFFVHDITMSDFARVQVDLSQFRGIAFPGGFSYADVLGSAVGWAASIKEKERTNEALENWRNDPNTFSLGVCNGCQLLALLGWIGAKESSVPSVRLKHNKSGRFESRWSRVKIAPSKSVLLSGMENSILGVWVAHGEGQFSYKSEDVKENIYKNNCVAIQYVDDDDKPTTKYPFNPNGSQDGVAGLVSHCGRHLALMPHPERCTLTWQHPYMGPHPSWTTENGPWTKLFQNAFDWCQKTC